MTSEKKYEIFQGPSKYDLFVSLGDDESYKERLIVTFKIKTGFTVGRGNAKAHEMGSVKTAIQSLERESGGGESWIFTGYATLDQEFGTIKGFYSSKTRTGNFCFI